MFARSRQVVDCQIDHEVLGHRLGHEQESFTQWSSSRRLPFQRLSAFRDRVNHQLKTAPASNSRQFNLVSIRVQVFLRDFDLQAIDLMCRDLVLRLFFFFAINA